MAYKKKPIKRVAVFGKDFNTVTELVKIIRKNRGKTPKVIFPWGAWMDKGKEKNECR